MATKILHIGLLSHFTPGMQYQDNLITEFNCKDGHEVLYISDTRRYINGALVDGSEEDIQIRNNFRLIRVKFDWNNLLKPIKKSRKVKKIINEFKPDTILVHGLVGYELITVKQYTQKNQHVKYYVDSHQSLQNYANTKIEGFLFSIINRFFVKRALPSIEKVLYIGLEEKKFLDAKYNIPEDKLEFFPLGGKVYSISDQEEQRQRLINELKLPDDAVLVGHSGKLDALKRTEDLLEGFSKLQDERFHLIIFGRIPDDRKNILVPMMQQNERVHFLGWKEGEEIDRLLMALDLYCQPNNVTATVQSALCCGCAMMLYPFDTYKYILGDNCFWVMSSKEIYDSLYTIAKSREVLDEMKEKDFQIAKKKLDYSILAKRICQ